MPAAPNQHLLIISPTAPPEVCGVSDYALQTATALQGLYSTIQLGVERLPKSPATTGGFRVTPWKQLLAQTGPQGSYDVLLNYTPTSYTWSGLAVSLLNALQRFKKAHPSNQVFTFFHETWNGSSELRPHHALQARLTKWSMQQIGELSRGVSVVNAEQQRKLELLLHRDNIHMNVIGSNILPAYPEAGLHSSRQPGVWLIFGLAHTRLWTLQAHLPLLQDMAARGVLRQLRAIGPTDTTYAQQELELGRTTLGADIFTQVGALKPEEVSEEMLHAEAALVGLNVDGLRKSGTFAALAAHAVPIICSVDPTLDEPPGHVFFQPEEVQAQPDILRSTLGEKRRQQLHTWFWQTRSWEAIGRSMRAWMQA
ncbi:hypothetical protein H8B15_05225 [Hymenobacter sp. BT507]|uniref:Glycosyltransferase n=1 Tax=Hymenobacter citatus TaxID=2763506 RepID=A0ABR7MGU8_9BACT|nr:hypothetical protein [Hymenobacter citatus]MBC6610309.1 hypothetical protein [Hymenobacter citatus]